MSGGTVDALDLGSSEETRESSSLSSSTDPAGVAQLVEHNLAKVGVAGSNPVSRSNKKTPPTRGFFVSA